MSTRPTLRTATRTISALDASDGAGVRLKRSLGTNALPMVDPFLMLDEFRSDDPNDYIAGFPAHPHRGFETVTIMLAGSMEHKDSVGNTGRLGPGSVQWMTAGRGIIHSEMPKQEQGLMWGFQLWVNLPAKDKLSPPRYQDIDATSIPAVDLDGGGQVRVVAGTVQGVTGPVSSGYTQPILLDVRLPSDGEWVHELPSTHNAFVYVYEGKLRVGSDDGRFVDRSHAVVLGRDGDAVRLRAGDAPARALIIAGRPIEEPVARYGPFVMNTAEEIQQAFRDYQSGALAR